MTSDAVPERESPRLLLRGLRAADREPFAALNADPVVMRHYPSTLTRGESDAFVERVAATWATYSYGLWALERRDTEEFVGYAGLWPVPAVIPVRDRPDPCVEVGWRLAAAHWGRGFATEAGQEALHYACATLHLPAVVSFTAVGNTRSRAVMERLGMTRGPGDDFDHPDLPAGHHLRRHVLYRIRCRAARGHPDGAR